MASSVCLLIFAIAAAVLISSTEGRDHLVGGKADGWKVPSSQSDSLNKWAGSSRFQVGDYLVFKFDSKKDSVLQVTRDAYINCSTTSPIEEYSNGEAKVRLDRSGPYYFISGAGDNCEKGQKLIVVVMSPRNRHTLLSPAPSPAEVEAPAVAPTSGATTMKGGLMVVLGVIVGLYSMI